MLDDLSVHGRRSRLLGLARLASYQLRLLKLAEDGVVLCLGVDRRISVCSDFALYVIQGPARKMVFIGGPSAKSLFTFEVDFGFFGCLVACNEYRHL